MTNSKFAPVCPIHMYSELKEMGPEYFGNYFLLLAHDVVKHPKEYNEVFCSDGEERMIITDNSVIELGTSVDSEILKEACNIVEAEVLAIPDVLEDGEATVKTAAEFICKWDPAGMAQEPELMFIPQGSDLDDYVGCVMNACDLDLPMDWIGIARNTTGRIVKSRQQLIGFFTTLQPLSKLHLLGFSVDTVDDMLCARSPLVQGIDSAVPLRTAHPYVEGCPNILDPGPRGTWWETGKLEKHQLNNVLVIQQWLNKELR